MSEPNEVRIVVESAGLGVKRLFLYDPATGRKTPKGPPLSTREDVDREVYRQRNQLQRSGCRVTVVEHSR